MRSRKNEYNKKPQDSTFLRFFVNFVFCDFQNLPSPD